jgi:hypothetical protein
VSQIDPDFSAFAAMRALRDQLRERLDQSEDYRAWMALDEALRQLEPGLPRAADFTFDAIKNRTRRRLEMASNSDELIANVAGTSSASTG